MRTETPLMYRCRTHLYEPKSKPIAPGKRIPLDHLVLQERREETMRGARRESRPIRDFGEGEITALLG